MPYDALDFYATDGLLTDEERIVRDTVRQFVDDRVMPHIGEWFERDHFPLDLVPEIGELGLLGMTLPETDGGGGLGQVAYGLANQELERGDSGLRSFVSVQNGLVIYPVWRYGSDAQKRAWLPRLASGEAIGCFGLTEPDHGSDPGGMETRAVKQADGGFTLNGAKMWITNGSIADVAVVWAKLDDKVRGFIVETNREGFSAPRHERKFSLRASVTSELILQDVHVPAEALLPKASGLGAPLSCLNQARYGIAWGAIGSAQACFDEALKYGQSRSQFGRPLAQFQLYQAKLAQIATEITKGQLLALQLGRLKERDQATPARVSMAKRNNVYWALETARLTRDMLGANGITFEYQCGRHLLNLESVKTYEGTHDIHTLILGAELTGMKAFS